MQMTYDCFDSKKRVACSVLSFQLLNLFHLGYDTAMEVQVFTHRYFAQDLALVPCGYFALSCCHRLALVTLRFQFPRRFIMTLVTPSLLHLLSFHQKYALAFDTASGIQDSNCVAVEL